MTIPEAESPSPDDGLDQLLAEARWPEDGKAPIARLRNEWRSITLARKRWIRATRLSAALAASLVAVSVVWWLLPGREREVRRTQAVDSHRAHSPDSLTIPKRQSSATAIESESPHDEAQAPTPLAIVDSTERPPLKPPGPESAPPSESAPQSRPPTAFERMMFAATQRRRGVETRATPDELLNAAITKLARNPDADVPETAKPLLAARASLTPRLIEIVESDGELSRRRAAIRLLGIVGDTNAVPVLSELIHSDEAHDVALPVLVRLCDASTLAGLIEAESDEQLRQHLLAGLLDRGDAASTAAFLGFVKQPSSRESALTSLALSHDPPVALLFEFLEGPQVRHRIAAGRVLGRLCDARVVEHLIGMAQHNLLRQEAMVALLQCPGERATDFVKHARNSPLLWPAVHAAEIHLQVDSRYNHRLPSRWEIN